MASQSFVLVQLFCLVMLARHSEPWGLLSDELSWDCKETNCHGIAKRRIVLGLQRDELSWDCKETNCHGIAKRRIVMGLQRDELSWDCKETNCHG
uniref:Uncharacterized protein n=1 Tax=Globodera rostochiensis TaxID=31243 RepID=A0A914HAF0_GLORO